MGHEDKFITMKKIYRLACYKQHKESKPELNRRLSIADVCPFKFTAIEEICKHCRWFQIIDETSPLRQKLIDTGTPTGQQISLKIRDFDELPYDPKKAVEDNGL